MTGDAHLQVAIKRMAEIFNNGFPLGYDGKLLEEILDPLAEPANLRHLAARALINPTLVARSEANPVLRKYCLAYDKEYNIEIRLNHYYLDAYSLDSIHDHKWPFASKVLSGTIDHMLFRTNSYEDIAGTFVTQHKRGDCYFLGGDFFHSFNASPGAITMMVRGAAVREDWTRVQLSCTAASVKSQKELVSERRTLTMEECQRFFVALDASLRS